MAHARVWRECTGGLTLRVRVTPRASRDAIGRVETLSDGAGVLKLRVRAVPAEGAANAAIRQLLASALRVPVGSISVTTGATVRIKTILIDGESAELAASLDSILKGD